MTTDAVLDLAYAGDGRVLVLTMQRPERMNALNAELLSQLHDAITRFDADDSLRVAIITGAGGRAFSAGGDLKEMAERAGSGAMVFPTPQLEAMTPSLIERLSKPVIAAIDGYCVAGGFELALACDIRLATTSSQFGLPEVSRGMIAGPGLVSLRHNLALGEAMLLHLTGDSLSAERAYSLGLIQALVPTRDDLMRRAFEIADRIASFEPSVVASIKSIVRTADRAATTALAPTIDERNAQIGRSELVAGTVGQFASRSGRPDPGR